MGVIIELTDEQAAYYRDCCKYQKEIELLIEKKAFDTRKGKIIIHFDNGIIMGINADFGLYKRRVKDDLTFFQK